MKRGRDDGLAEQIEALKVEIEALKGEKVKWEAKAEAAEREGNKGEAAEHLLEVRHEGSRCAVEGVEAGLIIANVALADQRRRLEELEARWMTPRRWLVRALH